MSTPVSALPSEIGEFHAVILDSINDGVFTVDRQWKITSFNRAAERITGVSRQDAVGRPCCEVLRASICEAACALRQTLATSRPVEPMQNASVAAWRDSGKMPRVGRDGPRRQADGTRWGPVWLFPPSSPEFWRGNCNPDPL